MSALQSHACCTVPPVVSEGYKEKGEWTTVDGIKTYVTGPSSASKAILLIYDIFGYFPQTLQGADILAHGDKENQYQVFIPDFFEGKPADISWYPPDTDEKGKKLGEFFNTTGAPGKAVERIPTLLKDIQSQHNAIKTWGVVGFCWGGKVVNLISKSSDHFKAAAVAHPAMVDAADAEGVSIPYLMIPTKDESKEDVEKWEKAIKSPAKVEWFHDQIHGFMAARGDLKDPKVEAAYKKGYELVLNWFHQYL